jgi:hypothetical protein
MEKLIKFSKKEIYLRRKKKLKIRLRVHKNDSSNMATIKFESSIKNKVKKTGSSGKIGSLKESFMKWRRYKFKRREANNFDLFKKKIPDTGPRKNLFYGAAPSPNKVLFG